MRPDFWIFASGAETIFWDTDYIPYVHGPRSHTTYLPKPEDVLNSHIIPDWEGIDGPKLDKRLVGVCVFPKCGKAAFCSIWQFGLKSQVCFLHKMCFDVGIEYEAAKWRRITDAMFFWF